MLNQQCVSNKERIFHCFVSVSLECLDAERMETIIKGKEFTDLLFALSFTKHNKYDVRI